MTWDGAASRPPARYLLLALLQVVGGLLLLAFAAFPTATSPRGIDLVLGLASIALGALSWFRLRRMPDWTVHASLAGSTAITFLLVLAMPTDQGQVLSSYGFLLVVAFAATFFAGRAFVAHLVAVVVLWLLAAGISDLWSSPMTPITVACLLVMLGSAFLHVTGQARAASSRMTAVWESQIDPFVVLDAVRDPSGAVVDLRYAEANPAAAEALGLPREQLVGRTVGSLFPGLRDERMFALFVAALQTGGSVVEDALPAQDLTGGPQRYMQVRAFHAGDSLAVTWSDVTDRVLRERDLDLRARTDDLTGFLTRRAGVDELRSLLDERRGTRRPGAVMFCDLDRFKDVNDLHGHDVGDTVLRTVGRRVRDAVRADDLVARIGGDEFLVVLLGPVDDDELRALGDKLAGAVGEPMTADGAALSVGVSIGVVRPGAAETADALIARADALMYEAKHSGRGQVLVG